MKRPEWKLITDFTVELYKSGLRAGDKVMLKHDIQIKDHKGTPTGEFHTAGEIWTVLPGSPDDPNVVRLKQPDGKRHFWDDDAGIYKTFEKT